MLSKDDILKVIKDYFEFRMSSKFMHLSNESCAVLSLSMNSYEISKDNILQINFYSENSHSFEDVRNIQYKVAKMLREKHELDFSFFDEFCL